MTEKTTWSPRTRRTTPMLRRASTPPTQMVGGATSAALYRALDLLVDAEVLRPLTDRKRSQAWGVGDMLDELDDLNVRIGAAARAHV